MVVPDDGRNPVAKRLGDSLTLPSRPTEQQIHWESPVHACARMRALPRATMRVEIQSKVLRFDLIIASPSRRTSRLSIGHY